MTETPRGGLPHRTLIDPRELRAIAHPVRVRIVEELFLDGPLTATQLSARLGESPANCSWHLRQLAKYGYVEEAGGGVGRQRPWRAVAESRTWGGRADGEAALAGEAMSELMIRREIEEYEEYRRRQGSEPEDWYDATFWSQSFTWLTAAELHQLQDDITALIMRHVERFTDPSTRPADARPIRFVAWGHPARPWSVDRPDAPPTDEPDAAPTDGPDSRRRRRTAPAPAAPDALPTDSSSTDGPPTDGPPTGAAQTDGSLTGAPPTSKAATGAAQTGEAARGEADTARAGAPYAEKAARRGAGAGASRGGRVAGRRGGSEGRR